MTINRRQFLSYSSLLLCSTAVPAYAKNLFATDEEIILGGGQYLDLDTQKVRQFLSIISLQSNQQNFIDTDFLPHGVHRNPQNISTMALFEKRGPGACEFDLQTQQVIRDIPCRKGHYFYGHGAYTIDGKLLLSTETKLDNLDGYIGIRDTKTLDYLGEFPSYGKEPHECKLIDNGKTLIVTNGGGAFIGEPPSITYIDVASQKLLEKIELSNKSFNAGHLAVDQDGDLIVISAPRSGLAKDQLGGVSIRPRGKKQKLESIFSPQAITSKMYGEALSVVIAEKQQMAAVTHPTANLVTFWSLRDRRLLKTLSLENPRGIELTQNERFFLISYGSTANLIKIDLATLSSTKSKIYNDTYFTGSHIYNWSRTMQELLSPNPFI